MLIERFDGVVDVRSGFDHPDEGAGDLHDLGPLVQRRVGVESGAAEGLCAS